MGKYRVRSKYSRACKKAKSVGHFKTSFGGKHVRVTVGTKGIHPSIRFGKVTYKPCSGNYSIRGKYGTYYSNTNSSNKAHGSYSNDNENWVADFFTYIWWIIKAFCEVVHEIMTGEF